MRCLNRQPTVTTQEAGPLLSALPVAVTAAIVLLFAGLVWRQSWPSPDQSDYQRQIEIVSTATELSTLIHVPNQVKLTDWSQKLDQPLETELELVVSDAKTAITYLADNFLPEQLRQPGANQ